jgi:hypothetical protein
MIESHRDNQNNIVKHNFNAIKSQEWPWLITTEAEGKKGELQSQFN